MKTSLRVNIDPKNQNQQTFQPLKHFCIGADIQQDWKIVLCSDPGTVSEVYYRNTFSTLI